MKRAIRIYVYFIFIFNGCFNSSNCVMASKHYEFESRANFINDDKVDKNFCPHSIYVY